MADVKEQEETKRFRGNSLDPILYCAVTTQKEQIARQPRKGTTAEATGKHLNS